MVTPASISSDAAPESILLQGKDEAVGRGIIARWRNE